MYLPRYFRGKVGTALALLEQLGAAELITATPAGPVTTFLPLLHQVAPDQESRGQESAALGSLIGHVARANDQWRVPALGQALVIARGPDFYVSPGWYAAKAEHGRVVPTWNYLTAHFRGRLVIHDDPEWLEDVVRRLTEHHEAGQLHPWSIDDAPRRYIDGMLAAIVGIEVVLEQIDVKAKLSQNRSPADIAGVVAGLELANDPEAVEQMRQAQRSTLPRTPGNG